MSLVIKARPGDRIRVGEVEICVVYARRGEAKLVFCGDRRVPICRQHSTTTSNPHLSKDGRDA